MKLTALRFVHKDRSPQENATAQRSIFVQLKVIQAYSGADIILALNPAGMMTIHGVLQCFSVDLCYLLECIAK